MHILTGLDKPNFARDNPKSHRALRARTVPRAIFETMSLTIQPFADVRELDSLGTPAAFNVSRTERVASAVAGAGLMLVGARRSSAWSIPLAVLGGALLFRGGSGRCELYRQLGWNTARPHRARGVADRQGIKIERSVFVRRDPDLVYRYWRRIENLPRFMPHLVSVEEKNDRMSHWVARGPAGSQVEWDAEILVDREGELISWESIPGSTVENAGSVWFRPKRGGTDVKVSMKLNPPAGLFGTAVAKVLGQSPGHQLESDLEKFRDLVEHEKDFVEWELRSERH